MLHWRRNSGLVVLWIVCAALLLAACGGDRDSDTPVDTPVPTPSPTSPLAAIATWTPIPSSTPRPTVTRAPTMTSAVVAYPTFAPPAETGLSAVDDQVIVTVLEADLNDAIAAAYAATTLIEANSAPVITFVPGRQIAIEASFTNTFLDELITVHVRVKTRVNNNAILLEELQEHRAWAGATPSNAAIWDVIDLVERGINNAVFAELRGQPGAGTLALIDVRQFPDAPQVRARLEAVFAE